MKKTSKKSSPQFASYQNYHVPSYAIFASLKPLMESAVGYHLDFRQLGRFLGVPPTTAWRWCTEHEDEHVRALFQILERLPLGQRHRAIDSLCRSLPSFGHQKLSHDPIAVSRLEGIGLKRTGLTIVRGEPEHMRTFTATALVIESQKLDAKHREPAGIDIHPPDRVQPALGVHYRPDKLPLAARLREFVSLTWEKVRSSDAPLVFLNGVWSIAPELKAEILETAERRHLVLADDFSRNGRRLPNTLPQPLHFVSVAPARENPRWIRVRVESQP